MGEDATSDARLTAFESALEILVGKNAPDRDAAKNELKRAVKDFQTFRQWEMDSPRRSDLLRSSKEIYSWATEGLQLLGRIDVDTRDFLNEGPPEEIFLENASLRDTSDIFSIILEPDDAPDGWQAKLEALAQLCRLRSEQLATGLGKDRGGSTNWFKERYGTAKHGLVYECSQLFDCYGSYDVNSTDGGRFYRFCAAAYEAATGEGGDEPGVGLKRYVQYSVQHLKLVREISQAIDELDAMVGNRTELTAEEQNRVSVQRKRLEDQRQEAHDAWQRGPR